MSWVVSRSGSVSATRSPCAASVTTFPLAYSGEWRRISSVHVGGSGDPSISSRNDDGPWSITVVTDDGSGAVQSGGATVEATATGLDQTAFVAFAVTHGGGVDAGPDLSTGPAGHTADLTAHAFSYSFVKEKAPAGCGCRIPARSSPLGASSLGMLALAVCALVGFRRTA